MSDTNKVLSTSDCESYANRLIALWENYHKVIGLQLVVSGATIAFLLNIVLSKPDPTKLANKDLLMWSVGVAALAGLVSIVARVTAQILMERQVYGKRSDAKAYFQLTESEPPWAVRHKSLNLIETIDSLVRWLPLLLLIGSWILAVFWLADNLYQ